MAILKPRSAVPVPPQKASVAPPLAATAAMPIAAAAKPSAAAPTADAIRRRAYQAWEAAGRPVGHDLAFWLQAERELSGAERHAKPFTHDRIPTADMDGQC